MQDGNFARSLISPKFCVAASAAASLPLRTFELGSVIFLPFLLSAAAFAAWQNLFLINDEGNVIILVAHRNKKIIHKTNISPSG